MKNKNEEYIKLFLFQDFIEKKIIYDLTKKTKIKKSINFFTKIKEQFEFNDDYTEKKLKQLYKKKTDYVTDIFNTFDNQDPKGEDVTYKANNFFFIPAGVYCFEIYDSANDKELEKLFKKLKEIGACSEKQKYDKCLKDLDKTKNDLYNRINSRCEKNFLNYYIPITSDYFDIISISLSLFGSNLFKITYFFCFKDDHRYLLRNYFTYGVKSKITVTKNCFNYPKNIIYDRADKRIKKIYSSFVESYYKEIKEFMKNNCSGIFYNLYKEFPCSIIYYFDHPVYYKKIQNYLLDDFKRTSAFKYLLDYNDRNKDMYLDTKNQSIFIPMDLRMKDYNDMIMIHACNYCSHFTSIEIHDMSWLTIIDYLFYKQYEAGKNILIKYNSFDIKKGIRLFRFYSDKRKINLISSITNMFENELYHLKKMNKNDYFSSFLNKYVLEISENTTLEFNKEYLHRIKNKSKTLSNMNKQLNDLYFDRFQQNNMMLNTWLQITITILTIITVILTVITLRNSKNENKNNNLYNDINIQLNNNINEENITPNDNYENELVEDYSDLEEIVIPEKLPTLVENK